MAKGMLKTNVMRTLEKEKIGYKAHEYPHGKEAVDGITVAKSLGQNPDCVFKTLVTTDTKKNFFVFVIPVGRELDLKKAAKTVKAKTIEMIPVKDIQKITGYIRGGCSPINMKKKYETVYHETAKECETIMVSAGKIGFQIELSPDDLIRVTDGKLADICKEG
ncbi:MAG: Cys-tRNA(Pro) deacylase [Lachnospiraceae bacterium]